MRHPVSIVINEPFVTDIVLPPVIKYDVDVIPVPADAIPVFDVNKTIINCMFNNKSFKLYKRRSGNNIIVNVSN
jgi:hypothetical protein